MNIVLDIIVVAAVFLFVFSGYKRGLINTVVHFFGAAVASIASSIIGSFLALHLYNTYIRFKIIQLISDNMPEITMASKANEIANGLMDNLPDYAKNFLSLAGFDIKSLTKEIANTKAKIPELIESLVRPISLKVTTIIITLALFVVFVAILSIFTKSLTSAVDIIGLSGINKLLGAVLGVLAAAVIVMIVSLVLYLLIAFLPPDSAEFIRNGINNSYIYKYIYSINLPEYLITIVTNGGKL